MAKKRQSANARLRKALRVREVRGPSWRLKYAPLVPSGIYDRKPGDLSDPEMWASIARWALKVTDKDRVLKKAFNAFSLDPNDPRSWRELTEILASAFFFERKPAGRRREWTFERRLELVEAVTVKRQRNPRLSFEMACKKLAEAKDSPPYFRNAGKEGLVKQLRLGRLEAKTRLAETQI